MPIENQILLENVNTITSSTIYSAKKKGAGYHANNDGLHTVVFQVNAYLGDIKIQGTLAPYPDDDDWVDVVNFAGDSTFYGAEDSVDYIKTVNFTGKFVWLRASYTLQNGTIRQIRYNY